MTMVKCLTDLFLKTERIEKETLKIFKSLTSHVQWFVSLWIHQKRSSRSQMFFKRHVLKNFTIFTGKHLCWSLKKETLTQMFFCVLSEISKNTLFYRTPSVAASVKNTKL